MSTAMYFNEMMHEPSAEERAEASRWQREIERMTTEALMHMKVSTLHHVEGAEVTTSWRAPNGEMVNFTREIHAPAFEIRTVLKTKVKEFFAGPIAERIAQDMKL